jgi:hypothetical protein
VARACPVCFAARDEAERLALLATTVLLTALPVIMIGAIVYWIARRSSELDGESTQTREPAEEHPAAESSSAAPLQRVH